MPDKIIIAARGSNLSLRQVGEVVKFLPKGMVYEVIKQKSLGDKNKRISLINNQIDDLFTRELDQLVLNNKADIAIHSAKDLPQKLPNGLNIITLTKPRDQRDILVFKKDFG